MDYEKKYKELLEKAKDFNFQGYMDEECLYDMFPELRESEGERVRKALVEIFSLVKENKKPVINKEDADLILAWLEKQKDINSKEYVFRPLAGCDINTAAIQAVEQQKLGKKIVLAFNGAYIPVEGKTADDIVNEYHSWLEKQGSITKLNEEEENKLAKGVLISCAMSFINYLDAHKYDGKMCVSNGECEDIENSFLNAMWDRLHRYYCKYIEKQGEQRTIDIESMVKAYKQRIIKQDGMENNPLIDMCLASFKHGVENTLGELNGEQILANSAKTCKNEPKFKDGDWIIHQGTENIYQVVAIIDNQYQLKYGNNYTVQKCADVDKCARLWTIQDAKDGDVLVNGSNIFIFHFLNDTRLMGYCHVNIDDRKFYDDIGKNECFCLIDAIVYPATIEQRDFLFKEMKKSGHRWDNDKKELERIVIDDGKAEMDYCFTKMMNGEK